MIVGIGFIGMLTGTIATFFINGVNEKTHENCIENKVIDLSDLEDEKFKDVLLFVDYIRNK